MNAFGAVGPRDMISRSDFEAVFAEEQRNSKGGSYIPNSGAINTGGSKKQ